MYCKQRNVQQKLNKGLLNFDDQLRKNITDDILGTIY